MFLISPSCAAFCRSAVTYDFNVYFFIKGNIKELTKTIEHFLKTLKQKLCLMC